MTSEVWSQVFGFTAGDDWADVIDWAQVTTIAWSADPQLVCSQGATDMGFRGLT